MRYIFVYHVFHLSFSALLEAAMESKWKQVPQRCTPIDLNELPPAELSPENLGCSDGQTSFSAAMNYYVDPNQKTINPDKYPVSEGFKIDDWSFLREHPEDTEVAEMQKGFLEFLKGCTVGSPTDEESVFFIQSNWVAHVQFMRNFKGKQPDPKYAIPQGKSSDYRYIRYYEILLRISNNNIKLGRNEIFSEEIVRAMMKRVKRNCQFVNDPSEVTEKMKKIKELVEEVTKVTHLMMVVVCSIYKEHEKDFLTVNEVTNHLNFMKELWFCLEEGRFEEGANTWKNKVHNILNFKSNNQSTRKIERYSLCRNFLRYWIGENEMHVKIGNEETNYQNTLTELINKMIYFSNYKTMIST
jgi:hypothetical protein